MFSCQTCSDLGREHQSAFEQYKLSAMRFSAPWLHEPEHQQVLLAIREARFACDVSIGELLSHLRGHWSNTTPDGAESARD
jgi:hypothetical protein